MSRFFSGLSPDELTESVRPLFGQAEPLELVFGETTELGPKRVTVRMVEYSSELKRLHNELRKLLDSTGAEYEYPQFIGKGHKPHVTFREGVQFNAGDRFVARAACLIEVVGKQRVICSKFELFIG